MWLDGCCPILHRRAMSNDWLCERNNCLQQISNGQICDNFYWLWRSQYVSNNLSHSSTHTLPFGRYIRQFTICETNIHCKICGLVENSQFAIFLPPQPRPIKVDEMSNWCAAYLLWKKVVCFSDDLFYQGFHGSHKTALNHFVLVGWHIGAVIC